MYIYTAYAVVILCLEIMLLLLDHTSVSTNTGLYRK